MAMLRCPECGQIFDERQDACGNCGCPSYECEIYSVSEQERQNEQMRREQLMRELQQQQQAQQQQQWQQAQQQQQWQQAQQQQQWQQAQAQQQAPSESKGQRETGNGIIHDSYNEAVPYSPFSPRSHFFKDPWPLSKYPKGVFDVKHPFLGYLFAPWHITCKDERKRESYNAINNIFYLLNLIFKAFVYAWWWTFFKVFLPVLLFVVIVAILIWIMAECRSSEVNVILGVVMAICYIAIIIYVTILEFCGIGKALHRYWDDIYQTFMRLNKRYWIKMNKAMKTGSLDDVN